MHHLRKTRSGGFFAFPIARRAVGGSSRAQRDNVASATARRERRSRIILLDAPSKKNPLRRVFRFLALAKCFLHCFSCRAFLRAHSAITRSATTFRLYAKVVFFPQRSWSNDVRPLSGSDLRHGRHYS